MMQRGHRRDAVKMVRGKIVFTDIRQQIIDIRKLRRVRPRDANHLRRKVHCGDVLRAFCQLSRKRTRATANFQGMAAFFRNMLQKKLVVVIVVRPAFTIEYRETIKVFGDNRHISH